jgi:hypothetical protein
VPASVITRSLEVNRQTNPQKARAAINALRYQLQHPLTSHDDCDIFPISSRRTTQAQIVRFCFSAISLHIHILLTLSRSLYSASPTATPSAATGTPSFADWRLPRQETLPDGTVSVPSTRRFTRH